MDIYPLDKFAQEIAAMPVCDEQDFLAFIPLAARLAALGDSSQLQRWPELTKPFRGRLAQLLIERGREGVWDLRNALGEDLGLAVIAAQDFSCLWTLEHDILPATAQNTLSAWFDEAEKTALDEDAVETIEIFLHRFPIPEDLRLNVMDAPLSTFEMAILASQARPRPTQEVHWPAEAMIPEPVYALEGHAPSDTLRDNFEKIDVPFEMDGVGRLFVSRRLDEDWRVLIDIHSDANEPLAIEFVRLGLFSAQLRHPEQDNSWEIALQYVDHPNRMEALRSELIINFRNGLRLRIC